MLSCWDTGLAEKAWGQSSRTNRDMDTRASCSTARSGLPEEERVPSHLEHRLQGLGLRPLTISGRLASIRAEWLTVRIEFFQLPLCRESWESERSRAQITC